MHSMPLRSHRAHVGFLWLHRTLDSLQALHEARSRIVFPSVAIDEEEEEELSWYY